MATYPEYLNTKKKSVAKRKLFQKYSKIEDANNSIAFTCLKLTMKDDFQVVKNTAFTSEQILSET